MDSASLVAATGPQFRDNGDEGEGDGRGKEEKKRTKTGCLTCRNRRVKCSEEHPICAKCSSLRLECIYGERKQREPPRFWDELPTLAAAPVPDYPDAQAAGLSSVPSELGGNFSLPGPSNVSEGQGAGTGLSDILAFDSPGAEDGWMSSPTFFYPVGAFEPFYPPDPEWHSMLTNAGSEPANLLTTLVLTEAERQALDYYQSRVIFGFASKTPAFSTYAILKKVANESLETLHLLLAASLAEIACSPQCQHLGVNAESHYALGLQGLTGILSVPETDPVIIMACFWFLYLYQKRRRTGDTVLWSQLSCMIAEYFQSSALHLRLSTAAGPEDGPTPMWSPVKRALLARLTVWFYGLDAQTSTHGEGGELSRLIWHSISTGGVLSMFEASRKTLPLHWEKGYPTEQLEDDLKNAAALELLHHVWAILQEINEAAVTCPISLEKRDRFKARMEEMRRKYPISLVFQLTESTERYGDRLMGNSDWAVGNYYAVCIYLFRCSLSEKEHDTSSAAGNDIARTATDLVELLQKTLGSGDKNQVDRMQFALFWAGVERPGQLGEWIRSQVYLHGLGQPLQTIMLTQLESGRRVSIERIRQIWRGLNGVVGELNLHDPHSGAVI